MNRPPEIHAFFSYKREDARDLVLKLHTSWFGQLRVRIDESELLPGEKWLPRLKKEIENAQFFVFVISPGSVAAFDDSSGELGICAIEANHAIALEKPIIPLLWHNAEHIDRLPSAITDHHFVSFESFRESGMSDENAFNLAAERLWTGLHADKARWTDESLAWLDRVTSWLNSGEQPEFLLTEKEYRDFIKWHSRYPDDRTMFENSYVAKFFRLSERAAELDH